MHACTMHCLRCTQNKMQKCFIKKKKESGDIISFQIATINKSTTAYLLRCTNIHTQTTSTHTYIAWRRITKNCNCNEPTTHEYCIFYNNNRKCVRRKMNFIWLECRHIHSRTQQYKTDIVSHTKNEIRCRYRKKHYDGRHVTHIKSYVM